jgi:hypothetical protein
MGSTPTSTRSIALVGAGRIGSAFAHRLARRPRCDRRGPPRLPAPRALQRDRAIVLTGASAPT